MNKQFVFESDSYTNTWNYSSIDWRTFQKLQNDGVRKENGGLAEKPSDNLGGQSYCFSAEKLKRFIELKKWSEQERLLNNRADDDIWMIPREEEYSMYNRMIEDCLAYLLSSTSLEMQSTQLRRMQEMEKVKLWSTSLEMQSTQWRRMQEMEKVKQEVSKTLRVVTEQQTESNNRKRRLCRHFLKGWCKRGESCDFLHDSSIFCPDRQKVFLGGLPSYITELNLRQKMAEQGYNVINKPKVLRGFTPQVCLGSVEEAQRLIKKGKIMIDDSWVDVRPYEEFVKDTQDKKLSDDIKRSVFLGGLPNGTTGKDIREELEKLDVKVVNHPLIKAGFTPQVVLDNAQQADMLVNLKKVKIRNTLVDIRPYVSYRIGSNRSRKY